MLSRWGNKDFIRESNTRKVCIYNVKKTIIPRSFLQFAPTFQLPSKQEIILAQNEKNKWIQQDLDYFENAMKNNKLFFINDGYYSEDCL